MNYYSSLLACKVSSNFTVFYQPKDVKVANEVLGFAEKELARISEDLGLKEKIKLKIWLAADESEIEKLTQGNFPDWGVGCAYPAKLAVILKSPRIIKYPLNIRTLVAHEISHVILGNLLKGTRIPRWFDEGVAMQESQEWEIGGSMRLSWANFTHSLLPLSDIDQDFPQESERARLAYTESFYAVSFMINEFGNESVKKIIESLKQTNSFSQALNMALGLNYRDFEYEWEKWVKERYTGFSVILKVFFPMGVILIIFFIVLFINLIQKRRKIRKLENLDST